MSSRSALAVNTAVVVATALAVLALARLLWLAGEVLLLVLIAVILAAGLSPVVEGLHRRRWSARGRRLPRTAAIVLVYAGLVVVVGLTGGLLVSPLVAEADEFVERAPALYRSLQESLTGLSQRYPWIPDLAGIVERLPHEVGRLSAYAGRATGVAFRVFGGVVSAISVLVLSIYMLIEGPGIRRAFLDLFPGRHHRRIGVVLDGIGRKFGGWLRGQLLLGLAVGLAAGIGVWALGLPYPFLLGVAAGITELIPMVGPVLGAIPAIVVALFGPPWKILGVVALFTLIQQAENHLLVPRVMRISVGLSPLLTIVAIMIGAKLMGVLGALLAVPVAAALQVVVGEVVGAFGPSGSSGGR